MPKILVLDGPAIPVAVPVAVSVSVPVVLRAPHHRAMEQCRWVETRYGRTPFVRKKCVRSTPVAALGIAGHSCSAPLKSQHNY